MLLDLLFSVFILEFDISKNCFIQLPTNFTTPDYGEKKEELKGVEKGKALQAANKNGSHLFI